MPSIYHWVLYAVAALGLLIGASAVVVSLNAVVRGERTAGCYGALVWLLLAGPLAAAGLVPTHGWFHWWYLPIPALLALASLIPHLLLWVVAGPHGRWLYRMRSDDLSWEWDTPALRQPRAAGALVAALATERCRALSFPGPESTQRVAALLRELQPAARPALLRGLRHWEPNVWRTCLKLVAESGDAGAVPAVARLLGYTRRADEALPALVSLVERTASQLPLAELRRLARHPDVVYWGRVKYVPESRVGGPPAEPRRSSTGCLAADVPDDGKPDDPFMLIQGADAMVSALCPLPCSALRAAAARELGRRGVE